MARRRRRRMRRSAGLPGRSFLRRRSTPWLIGAITLAALAAVLATFAGGDDDSGADVTPTAGALVSPVAATPLPTVTPPVAVRDGGAPRVEAAIASRAHGSGPDVGPHGLAYQLQKGGIGVVEAPRELSIGQLG